MIGNLKLTVVKAELTRNTESFGGKMDPFCVIKYRDQEHKTTVKDSAGKTPEWNETFALDIFDIKNDSLNLTVLEKDNFSNDTVGDVTIQMKSLCSLENGAESFEIKYKNKSAGKVYLKYDYTPISKPKFETKPEETVKKAEPKIEPKPLEE